MPRNPYHEEDGTPKLKPSVFAYIDLLGYRQTMLEHEKSGDQNAFLEELHGALTEARKWLEHSELSEFLGYQLFSLKAFSDNIAIGWPIHDDGESEIGDAFSRLADFQFAMVQKGFFIRGAISVGTAFVDEIAVLGSALIEAYNGEGVLARDPRIILTKSAVRIVKTHLGYYGNKPHAPQNRDILQDSDGQWFLNYLDSVLIAEDEHGPYYEDLEIHKKMVEKNLEQHKHNPPIFSKYAWVANYHNYFCDLHSHHFSEEHKIPTELFRARPKSILE